MQTPSTISILGCGWLGFPLAQSLVANNWNVLGSTTSPSKLATLSQNGISPFLLQLGQFSTDESSIPFFQSPYLIVNFPPRLRSSEGNGLEKQMNELDQRLSAGKCQKAIFISSTSVYPDLNREVTEADAQIDHPLVLAENQFMQSCQRNQIDYLIFRCGGIMGYDRYVGKYYTGKTYPSAAQVPINYIHQKDIIAAINHVLSNKIWNKVYNLVAPLHPKRREAIEKSCEKYQLPLPEFSDTNQDESFKIVRGDAFIRDFSYTFLYPDPLTFP